MLIIRTKMTKEEKERIIDTVSTINDIDTCRVRKKHIQTILKDFETMTLRDFQNEWYKACTNFSIEGMKYYRRMLTKKINCLKGMY